MRKIEKKITKNAEYVLRQKKKKRKRKADA